MRAELAAGKLSFFLRGEKLKGSFALVRTRKSEQWLLIKHKDRFALAQRGARAGSARCSRRQPRGHGNASRRHRVCRRRGSRRAAPAERCRAPWRRCWRRAANPRARTRSGATSPSSTAIASLPSSSRPVRLQSRRGLELTPSFPEIVAELAAQAGDQMILDGEIVALGADGAPVLQRPAESSAAEKRGGDIAAAQREHAGGAGVLRPAALCRRESARAPRTPIGAATSRSACCHRRTCNWCTSGSDAEQLYAGGARERLRGHDRQATRQSLSAAGSARAPGCKVKAGAPAEFVDRRLHARQGRARASGRAAAGVLGGQAARYAGHVGSGLDDGAHRELLERAAKLKRAALAVRRAAAAAPADHLARAASSWPRSATASGHPMDLLRAPVFLRLRDDIEPRSSAHRGRRPRRSARERSAAARAARRHRRQPASEIDCGAAAAGRSGPALDLAGRRRAHRLTNLDRRVLAGRCEAAPPRNHQARSDRAIWRRVSRFMLPHLEDRPLTMIRMPEGIGGERFFQKHWEQTLPEFVETVTVFSETQGRAPPLPARQQPADTAVAGPGRHTRVPRVALTRHSRCRRPPAPGPTTPARSTRSSPRS